MIIIIMLYKCAFNFKRLFKSLIYENPYIRTFQKTHKIIYSQNISQRSSNFYQNKLNGSISFLSKNEMLYMIYNVIVK